MAEEKDYDLNKEQEDESLNLEDTRLDDTVEDKAESDPDLDLDTDDIGERKTVSPSAKYLSSAVKGLGKGTMKGVSSAAKTMFPNITTAVDEIKSTFDEFVKTKDEVRDQMIPEMKKMKRSAKRVAPRVERYMPNELARKLEEATEGWEKAGKKKEDEKQQTEEEKREASIQSAVEQAMSRQGELQKALADEQRTDRKMEQIRESVRFEQQQRTLLSIDRSLVSIDSFHRKVHTEFLKKDLELQYKQLYSSQDIKKSLQYIAPILEDNLKGIEQNTALPEYLKRRGIEEKLKEQRLRVTGGIGDLLARTRENIVKTGKEKLVGGVQQAGEMADMLAGAAEMQQDFTQMEEEDLTEEEKAIKRRQEMIQGGTGILGRIAGSEGGRRLLSRVSKTAKGIDEYGENFEERTGLWLQQMRERGKQKGGFAEWLASWVPETEKSRPFEEAGWEEAQERADFDKATKRSIVEIIPGYLAKQLKTMQDFAYGGQHEELVYNVEKQKFTTAEQMREDIKREAFGPAEGRQERSLKAAGVAREKIQEVEGGEGEQVATFDEYQDDIARVLTNHAVYMKPLMPDQIIAFTRGEEQGYNNEYISQITEGIDPERRATVMDLFATALTKPDGRIDHDARKAMEKQLIGQMTDDKYKKVFQTLFEGYGMRRHFGDLITEEGGLDLEEIAKVRAGEEHERTEEERQERRETVGREAKAYGRKKQEKREEQEKIRQWTEKTFGEESFVTESLKGAVGGLREATQRIQDWNQSLMTPGETIRRGAEAAAEKGTEAAETKGGRTQAAWDWLRDQARTVLPPSEADAFLRTKEEAEERKRKTKEEQESELQKKYERRYGERDRTVGTLGEETPVTDVIKQGAAGTAAPAGGFKASDIGQSVIDRYNNTWHSFWTETVDKFKEYYQNILDVVKQIRDCICGGGGPPSGGPGPGGPGGPPGGWRPDKLPKPPMRFPGGRESPDTTPEQFRQAEGGEEEAGYFASLMEKAQTGFGHVRTSMGEVAETGREKAKAGYSTMREKAKAGYSTVREKAGQVREADIRGGLRSGAERGTEKGRELMGGMKEKTIQAVEQLQIHILNKSDDMPQGRKYNQLLNAYEQLEDLKQGRMTGNVLKQLKDIKQQVSDALAEAKETMTEESEEAGGRMEKLAVDMRTKAEKAGGSAGSKGKGIGQKLSEIYESTVEKAKQTGGRVKEATTDLPAWEDRTDLAERGQEWMSELASKIGEQVSSARQKIRKGVKGETATDLEDLKAEIRKERKEGGGVTAEAPSEFWRQTVEQKQQTDARIIDLLAIIADANAKPGLVKKILQGTKGSVMATGRFLKKAGKGIGKGIGYGAYGTGKGLWEAGRGIGGAVPPAWRGTKKVFGGAWEGITTAKDITGEGLRRGKEAAGGLLEKIKPSKKPKKTKRKYFDVYRQGEIEPGNPLISAEQQQNNEVRFNDNKKIKRTSDIDRPVLDVETGNTLISQNDLEHGLVDQFGNPIYQMEEKEEDEEKGEGKLGQLLKGLKDKGAGILEGGTLGAVKDTAVGAISGLWNKFMQKTTPEDDPLLVTVREIRDFMQNKFDRMDEAIRMYIESEKEEDVRKGSAAYLRKQGREEEDEETDRKGGIVSAAPTFKEYAKRMQEGEGGWMQETKAEAGAEAATKVGGSVVAGLGAIGRWMKGKFGSLWDKLGGRSLMKGLKSVAKRMGGRLAAPFIGTTLGSIAAKGAGILGAGAAGAAVGYAGYKTVVEPAMEAQERVDEQERKRASSNIGELRRIFEQGVEAGVPPEKFKEVINPFGIKQDEQKKLADDAVANQYLEQYNQIILDHQVKDEVKLAVTERRAQRQRRNMALYQKYLAELQESGVSSSRIDNFRDIKSVAPQKGGKEKITSLFKKIMEDAGKEEELEKFERETDISKIASEAAGVYARKFKKEMSKEGAMVEPARGVAKDYLKGWLQSTYPNLSASAMAGIVRAAVLHQKGKHEAAKAIETRMTEDDKIKDEQLEKSASAKETKESLQTIKKKASEFYSKQVVKLIDESAWDETKTGVEFVNLMPGSPVGNAVKQGKDKAKKALEDWLDKHYSHLPAIAKTKLVQAVIAEHEAGKGTDKKAEQLVDQLSGKDPLQTIMSGIQSEKKKDKVDKIVANAVKQYKEEYQNRYDELRYGSGPDDLDKIEAAAKSNAEQGVKDWLNKKYPEMDSSQKELVVQAAVAKTEGKEKKLQRTKRKMAGRDKLMDIVKSSLEEKKEKNIDELVAKARSKYKEIAEKNKSIFNWSLDESQKAQALSTAEAYLVTDHGVDKETAAQIAKVAQMKYHGKDEKAEKKSDKLLKKLDMSDVAGELNIDNVKAEAKKKFKEFRKQAKKELGADEGDVDADAIDGKAVSRLKEWLADRYPRLGSDKIAQIAAEARNQGRKEEAEAKKDKEEKSKEQQRKDADREKKQKKAKPKEKESKDPSNMSLKEKVTQLVQIHKKVQKEFGGGRGGREAAEVEIKKVNKEEGYGFNHTEILQILSAGEGRQSIDEAVKMIQKIRKKRKGETTVAESPSKAAAEKKQKEVEDITKGKPEAKTGTHTKKTKAEKEKADKAEKKAEEAKQAAEEEKKKRDEEIKAINGLWSELQFLRGDLATMPESMESLKQVPDKVAQAVEENAGGNQVAAINNTNVRAEQDRQQRLDVRKNRGGK